MARYCFVDPTQLLLTSCSDRVLMNQICAAFSLQATICKQLRRWHHPEPSCQRRSCGEVLNDGILTFPVCTRKGCFWLSCIVDRRSDWKSAPRILIRLFRRLAVAGAYKGLGNEFQVLCFSSCTPCATESRSRLPKTRYKLPVFASLSSISTTSSRL